MPRAVSHLGQGRRHIRRCSRGRQPGRHRGEHHRPRQCHRHAHGGQQPPPGARQRNIIRRRGRIGDVHALAGHHQTTRVDTIGRAGQQTHLVLARLDAEHTEIIRIDDTNVGDPIRQRVSQHLDREPVSDMTLPPTQTVERSGNVL